MFSTLFDYFKDTFAYASFSIDIALSQIGIQLDIKITLLTNIES
jgi:hypothetical protein